MPSEHRPIEPRTFFLNELHELGPSEKPGGGRIPQYVGIEWASRGRRIGASLEKLQRTLLASKDPLRESRYFVLANPVPEVTRKLKDKRKAPDGTITEKTDYGGEHARDFGRLGFDLIHVTDDGRAVVHAQRDRFEQLAQKAARLQEVGPREQSRWVRIDAFETIPVELRIDSDWLAEIKGDDLADVVVELQPLLSRVEVEDVLRAIVDLLVPRRGEKLTGTGTDFSGRHWFRGKASRRSLREIAREFFSVQALHPPLYSIAAGKATGRQVDSSQVSHERTEHVEATSLPCVAVLDLGVPANHKQLARFRRGAFVAPGAAKPPVGGHGSFVASRVVFGHQESADALNDSVGSCAFYDVMVGDFPVDPRRGRADDKVAMDGCESVLDVAPDVRVVNFSFGDDRPLGELAEVKRREKLVTLRELDNLIFARDVIVVIAAGNTPPGVSPQQPYPDHHDDPRWALGPWACGFNTLVCGSYVDSLSANGLVKDVGWPSPFSRVGPGVSDAPVPGFGAPGGNADENYLGAPGLGVWGFSETGFPEDRMGTSYAAPILAREAAFTIDRLQKYCPTGGRPFAVTVKAFLALTATPSTKDERVSELVKRTLGRGRASAEQLDSPQRSSAVMLWQGVIGSPSEKVAVQVPVPKGWLNEAHAPRMRLVASWDVPVTDAARSRWACREVSIQLRPGPDARALHRSGGGHKTYPLHDRVYDLRKPVHKKQIEGDLWLIELSYKEIADYPAGMDFDPAQRIAFALELYDASEKPVDPQPAVQALPIAASMVRLSMPPVPIRHPVIITSRG